MFITLDVNLAHRTKLMGSNTHLLLYYFLRSDQETKKSNFFTNNLGTNNGCPIGYISSHILLKYFQKHFRWLKAPVHHYGMLLLLTANVPINCTIFNHCCPSSNVRWTVHSTSEGFSVETHSAACEQQRKQSWKDFSKRNTNRANACRQDHLYKDVSGNTGKKSDNESRTIHSLIHYDTTPTYWLVRSDSSKYEVRTERTASRAE